MSHSAKKRNTVDFKTTCLVIAEQERSKKLWSEEEAESLGTETLAGFRLFAHSEWILQDKPIWTIFEETGDLKDKVEITRVRLIGEKQDSLASHFFASPPANSTFKDTHLGRVLLCPLPPLPSKSHRSSKSSSKRHSNSQNEPYRIAIPDGKFDLFEQMLAHQAYLIRYFNFYPYGGYISTDKDIFKSTKDAFCSTYHLRNTTNDSDSQNDPFFSTIKDFSQTIQSCLSCLGLCSSKSIDGHFDANMNTNIKNFQTEFNRNQEQTRLALLQIGEAKINGNPNPSLNINDNDTQNIKESQNKLNVDGYIDLKTYQALLGEIWSLKTKLESFGFPTPSDPVKTPKRFRHILKSIKSYLEHDVGIEVQGGMHAIPAMITEIYLASNELNPKLGLSPTSKSTLPQTVVKDRVLQLSALATKMAKNKASTEKRRSGQHKKPEKSPAKSTSKISQNVPPPIFEIASQQVSNDLTPDSIRSPRRNVSLPADMISVKIQNRLSTLNPSLSTDSSSSSHPILPSSPSTSNKSTPFDIFFVPDREFFRFWSNWAQEIEIIEPTIILPGYLLYLDPQYVLSDMYPCTVVTKGGPNDSVLGMTIRRKLSVNSPRKSSDTSPLWNFYTNPPNRGHQQYCTKTFYGSMIVEDLTEEQIAERSLLRCPDGNASTHLPNLKLQNTLSKLSCQAKDFEYSLAVNSNLRTQDQFYIKYKIERSIPIQDAVNNVVRNIQCCLIALNILDIAHFSLHYTNHVGDAVAQFHQDYLSTQPMGPNFPVLDPILVPGNINFNLYELMMNQTNQLQSTLTELGFQLPVSAFEDPAQFIKVTMSFQASYGIFVDVGKNLLPFALAELSWSTESNPVAENTVAASSAPKAISTPHAGFGHRPKALSFDFTPKTASFGSPGEHSNMSMFMSGSPTAVFSTSPSLNAIDLGSEHNTPKHLQPTVHGDIEFGSSLEAKYKQALEKQEELQAQYFALEENYCRLQEDVAEANTALQFFEDKYKESIENYDNLQRDFTQVNAIITDNDDAIQSLLQHVAILEGKLQKLQRRSQRNILKQFIWYLILLVLYIFILPALGVAFLNDNYKAKFMGIQINEGNSMVARLHRYSKHQISKLEAQVDRLEEKAVHLAGLENFVDEDKKFN